MFKEQILRLNSKILEMVWFERALCDFSPEGEGRTNKQV